MKKEKEVIVKDDVIVLKNPILVDGKEYAELPFDTSCYGASEHRLANKRFKEEIQGGVQEVDFDYHLIIAKTIIEASSHGDITYDDLSRIKGSDLFKVQKAGRNFLFESEAEVQAISGEQSEAIAELSPEQAR